MYKAKKQDGGVHRLVEGSRRGLAILAGGLSFAGAVNAADLMVNGSFESVTGGTPQYGGRTDGIEAGWNGIVSSLPSASAFYAGPAIPASENPGLFYSWRHQNAVGAYSAFITPVTDLSYVATNALKQTVNLTNAITAAD